MYNNIELTHSQVISIKKYIKTRGLNDK